MPSTNKTSHVILTLTSCTAEIWGLKTLDKSKVFKIHYGGRSAYVHQRLFVSRKNDAREQLADRGLVITSNKDWQELLDGIDEIVRFEKAPLLEHPGWTGNFFAQANRKVYAPDAQPKPDVMFARSTVVASSKGTYAGWREDVAEPLTGQTIPMIAVLAALAAPMVRFSGEDLNFGLEFSGPPESGKTLSLFLMASTTGRHSALANFNATMAGTEDMFPDYNDSPFPIDEANLAERGGAAFMKNFAFRMANGTMKVTRFQRDRAQYRFIFATTANAPFYSQLGAYDPETAGAALQRLIPIRVPADNSLGVFDFLPENFASSRALATHLKDAMARQYGTPMRRLLQSLVDARARDEQALLRNIQSKISTFEDAVGVAAASRGGTRASSAFGLLYAAGCFGKLIGVLPAGWDCLAACVAAYRNYQAQLPAHTPLPARLLTIAKRPETLDLRGAELPSLTDNEVERHGAFLTLGVGGRVELLLTDDLKRTCFSDWTGISKTSEFTALNLRGGSHIGKHRRIRRGHKKERYICFVLPSALASLISPAGGTEQ